VNNKIILDNESFLRKQIQFSSLCSVFSLQFSFLEAANAAEGIQQEGSALPSVRPEDSVVPQSDQGQCHESVAVVHRADM
jgi:hypothetical protein